MARRLLLLSIPAVLAAALWLLFAQGRSESDRGAVAPRAAAEASGEERPAGQRTTPPPVAPGADVAAVDGAAREAVEAVEGTEVPAAAPGSSARLAGRVVLTADGGRFEDLSGSLRLTLFQGSFGTAREVEVRGGRFEVEAPSGADPLRVTIAVERGELGGRGAVDAVAGVHTGVGPGPDGTWTLETVGAYDPRFEIVAAESGVTLPDALVHAVDTSFAFDGLGPIHPSTGLGERLAGPGPSPLSFAYEIAVDSFYPSVAVGAPGRVWQQVRADPLRPAPRRVELAAAGALDLTLVGLQAGSDLELRVRAPEGREDPFCARPLGSLEPLLAASQPLRIEALPPGVWEVSVERGTVWDPTSFGAARATVLAGAVVPVTIEIDPAAGMEEPRFVTALDVRLPAAWGADDLDWLTLRRGAPDGRQLETKGRSTAEATEEDGPTLHRLDLGALPIGDYVLHLEALGLASAFRVDGSGRSAVAFGAPVVLEARVFGPDGATPVDGLIVTWDAPVPGVGQTHIQLRRRAPGSYLGRALPGAGEVRLFGSEVGLRLEPFELSPAGGLLEIILSPTAEVELRFVRDGEPLDLPTDARTPPVTTLAGESAGASYTLQGLEVLVRLPAPASYRLVPEGLPGHRLPEPIEFDLAPDERRVVEIEYVREGG